MNILSIIYPEKCVICDQILRKNENQICRKCSKRLQPIHGDICKKCGKPVKEGVQICYDCKRHSHFYQWGIACYQYADIAKALYRIKYAGRQDIIPFFAHQMAREMIKDIKGLKADYLIPVPMHKARERKRGYNQAFLLAQVLSEEWNIPVCKNVVQRKKRTVPMKYLTPHQRQINLKKAFIIGPNDVKLKTIIIIDDIYTTGTTIDAISKVLIGAGASNIYFATLAIGTNR